MAMVNPVLFLRRSAGSAPCSLWLSEMSALCILLARLVTAMFTTWKGAVGTGGVGRSIDKGKPIT